MEIRRRWSWEPPEPTDGGMPDVLVMADVFRASTTLAALLAVRARAVVAVDDPDAIVAMTAAGAVLVSEVLAGGLDNSPTQVLARAGWPEATAVHKSTNLTRVVVEGGDARRRAAGGFANAGAVVAAVRASGAQRVALVAAGHFARREPAPEDECGTRYLEARLRGDTAAAAAALADARAWLATRYGRASDKESHYWRDVALALEPDRFDTVPEFVPSGAGRWDVVPWGSR